MTSPPLVVDLDGTLVKTDLLIEALFVLLKQNPLYVFAIPVWRLKGKAYLKQQIAQRVTLDVSVLPYQRELLDYLKTQRAQRRRLVLATANDAELARQVADHLQLFDTILGSDGSTNLSGTSKRDRLVTMFGEQGFDYAGHAQSDFAVWASARKAIVVNPRRHVRSVVPRLAEVAWTLDDRQGGCRPYLRALRPHQWLKNLLIFVPLLTLPDVQGLAVLPQACLAFVAFGLCAFERLPPQRPARFVGRPASSA